MKTSICLLVIGILNVITLLSTVLLFPISLLAQSSSNEAAKLDATRIYEQSIPSVVFILTVNKSGQASTGSGVIVRSDGIIATNYHVIDGAVSAQVKLRSGDIYDDVAVLDTDERKDIALIQIKAINLPTLTFGDSDLVKVGNVTYTISAPRELEGSLSAGIISSIRAAEELAEELKGFRLIQFTASISPGSSGGPLLDGSGRIIGLVFALRPGGQNLNFAVPSNYITPLVRNWKGASRSLAKMTKAALLRAQQPPQSRPARSLAEVAATAKSICVLTSENANPQVRSEITKKILQWGRLTVVTLPQDADLILEVTQIGEYSMKDHFGAYSSVAGILREKGSSTELWTTTKGSYWSMSGFSISKVSSQLGDAFVKFYNAVLKKAGK